jgi:hypothetical protein
MSTCGCDLEVPDGHIFGHFVLEHLIEPASILGVKSASIPASADRSARELIPLKRRPELQRGG